MNNLIIMASKVQRHFGFPTTDFYNLVIDILERIADFDDEEEIWNAINDSLIYYDNQWEVLKHYQNPQQANFDTAMEEFTSDIFDLIAELKGEQK